MSKNIFLTGATGFLGAHVIPNLLQQTTAQIFCLVRPRPELSAHDRLWKKLKKNTEIREKDYDRIVVLSGDITMDDLGLSDSFDKRIDEFWHCAAALHFDLHREKKTMQVNYEGTRNVLKFMKTRKIPLINFISTAYVSGQASGSIEEDINEHFLPPHNPYERSKRLCETEIIKAHREDGIAYRIIRPAIIVGDSSSLVADSESGLYAYLSILLRLKDNLESKMPEYFTFNPLKILIKEGATVNLICVDHVASLLIKICVNESTVNRVFHLTNPHPVPIERFCRTVGEALGISVSVVHDENELSIIDHFLRMEEEVFNPYLHTVQFFECDKAYTVANMDKNIPKLNYKQEFQIIENVKKSFEEDERIQRARLVSVVHKLNCRELNVDGKETLKYYVGGTGAPLVILNAYGQSLSFWDSAVDMLFESYKVVIWPMRGTASQKGGVSQVCSIEEHSEDIKLILDKEGIVECYILAWCTGPKVALQFKHKYPGYVKSMIFLGSCFKGIPQFSAYHTEYENNMQQICSRISANPAIAPIVMETIKNILTKSKSPSLPVELEDESNKKNLLTNVLSLVSENIKPMIIEAFLTPSSVINYARQLLLHWDTDVAGLLKTLDVPVLIITGSEDKIASPEMSMAAGALSPNITCALIQGGTHFLQLENTKLTAAMAKEFIENPVDFDFKHGLVSINNVIQNGN